MSPRLILLTAILLWAPCGGCRNADQLPTYPVTGHVRLAGGGPVGEGTILFLSEEHGMAASGAIEEDGRFTLGTYGERDGAVAGWHAVAVIPAPPDEDPDAYPSAPPPLDRKFMHPDTSGLRFEVQSGGSNEFEVTVHRSR